MSSSIHSSEWYRMRFFGPSGLCRDIKGNGYFGKGRHVMPKNKGLEVKIPAQKPGPMGAIIFKMGTYKKEKFYDKYAKIVRPLALVAGSTCCVIAIGWAWFDGGVGGANAAPTWSTPAPLYTGVSNAPMPRAQGFTQSDGRVTFNWGNQDNRRPLTTIQPPLLVIPPGFNCDPLWIPRANPSLPGQAAGGGYRLLRPQTFPGQLGSGS